jgi:hypothetical protein
MFPYRFRLLVGNFFLDRFEQTSPSQKSNEYHNLRRNYKQMYEQLKGASSPEMQEELMKFTEVINAMDALDSMLLFRRGLSRWSSIYEIFATSRS